MVSVQRDLFLQLPDYAAMKKHKFKQQLSDELSAYFRTKYSSYRAAKPQKVKIIQEVNEYLKPLNDKFGCGLCAWVDYEGYGSGGRMKITIW